MNINLARLASRLARRIRSRSHDKLLKKKGTCPLAFRKWGAEFVIRWNATNGSRALIASAERLPEPFTANGARPRPTSLKVMASKSSTLDQYEGQSTNKDQAKIMNPDAKASDPSDKKFEHPANLEMPCFHAMPQRGFMSDPCGPMYDPNHDRYHIFWHSHIPLMLVLS